LIGETPRIVDETKLDFHRSNKLRSNVTSATLNQNFNLKPKQRISLFQNAVFSSLEIFENPNRWYRLKKRKN
jgi:hypothetical protein